MTGHCQPTPLPETPRHTGASMAQSLVGSLLLSHWSWCTQGFVCALQESLFPQFCGSSIVKELTSKSVTADLQSQICLGYSVPLPDPQDEKSIVGPRTFTAV